MQTFLENGPRNDIYRGVTEARLGKGRSWNVMSLQHRPQLIQKGVLGLGRPLSVISREDKQAGLCTLFPTSRSLDDDSSSPNYGHKLGLDSSHLSRAIPEDGLIGELQQSYTSHWWGQGVSVLKGGPSTIYV